MRIETCGDIGPNASNENSAFILDASICCTLGIDNLIHTLSRIRQTGRTRYCNDM